MPASVDKMQLIWQSEEIPSEERATDVAIPREEFELPSVGPSYFWKVRSTAGIGGGWGGWIFYELFLRGSAAPTNN